MTFKPLQMSAICLALLTSACADGSFGGPLGGQVYDTRPAPSYNRNGVAFDASTMNLYEWSQGIPQTRRRETTYEGLAIGGHLLTPDGYGGLHAVY